MCSLFIDQRLLVPARRRPGNMQQVCSMIIVGVVAYYHLLLLKLLLVDMDHNCMTTGFEVHACTVTMPSHREGKFIS